LNATRTAPSGYDRMADVVRLPQATYGKRQVGLCCPACDRGQRASECKSWIEESRTCVRSLEDNERVQELDIQDNERASARYRGQRASARVGLRSHVLQAPVSKLKICGASWRMVRVLYEQKLLLSLKTRSSWRSMVQGVTQRMGRMLRILVVLASNYI